MSLAISVGISFFWGEETELTLDSADFSGKIWRGEIYGNMTADWKRSVPWIELIPDRLQLGHMMFR